MTDTKRLFFALWPDAATRDALHRLQQSLQLDGRLTPAANFHLTLAFLGEQPVSALAALQDILASLRQPAIPLDLDRTGYFPRLRLAWAGMRHPPDSLMRLQQEVQEKLGQAGIDYAPSQAFRPHVTLARKTAPPGDWPGEAIQWQAGEAVLAESHISPQQGTGALYRVLASQHLEPGR